VKQERETNLLIMKIYRSILLNEGEKIDSENIGCSWTLDEVFAHDHAQDINRAQGKDGYVIIEAEISVEQIDMNNTLFAMEQRSHEYEVVLSGGQIEATVIHNEWTDVEEGTVINGRVGNNDFEDYCNDYEGELTMEDFIEVSEDF
jgi:hypothetical protein